MARKISSRLEDLDLSQDELNRLGEALKKEEFRELLFQYAREINDPENKKRYEEEMTQLEKERGVDIKFVHPDPQYVLKTYFNPGGEKVFLNICSNSLVGKPTMKRSVDSKGVPGISWSIPLIQAPPREDLDKSGILCTVYDVLFHPDAHSLAAKDKKFRAFLEDTSLNAVEETFSVKLDRSSVKRPRMKFKGTPKPTVIRTRLSETNAEKEEDDFINQLAYPYAIPPKDQPSVLEIKCEKLEGPAVESSRKHSYVTPKYILKQSSDVDMSNYELNHLSHHEITIPQRLLLIVDLPYVKSSSELELDVEEQKMSLISIGKRRYKLELKLPYPVKETEGSAKFDQEAGKLMVTLVVNREKVVLKNSNVPEGDSGIESDVCYSRLSSGEEEEAKDVMEGMTTPFMEMQEEGLPTLEPLVDGVKWVKKSPDSSCDLVTAATDALMKAEENKDVEGSQNLACEELKEELDTIPPKTTQMCENILTTSGVKNEYSPSAENDVKHVKIMQGLFFPEVQYAVPLFTCNCLREAESMLITFVLQVKNVDPSSVKKRVMCVSGISIDMYKQKSLKDDLHDDSSLSPENGSVCNEYRTLKKSGIPSCGPLMTNAGVNDHEATCGINLSIDNERTSNSIKGPTSSASQKCTLNCDINQVVSGEELKLYGANISTTSRVVENELTDKFRESLVIKDDVTSTEFQAVADSTKCDKEITCFHVTFNSIGAGFFPQNYAFCMGFPSMMWPFIDSNTVDAIPVNVEVWDNNIEVQLKRSCCKSDAVGDIECFVGKDPSTILPYMLPPFEEKLTESESFSDPEFSSLTSVSEDLRDEGTKEESDSSGIGKENHGLTNGTVLTAPGKRKIFKERTLSESSVESVTSKQATKGILKRSGRASLGRSLSESSGGEEYSWIGSAQHLSLSSSVTSSPSLTEIGRIPLGESLKEEEEEYDEEEEDDDDDGEKVKKIVRFSDVISKKTYRSNASILGQRKKNQRKLKNKKRAAERRASESENSIDEVEPSSENAADDPVSEMSPPQKNEIPLPSNLSTMSELSEAQSAKEKPKGFAKKKGNGNKCKGKKVIESPKSDDSSGNPVSPQYEFKSDLIFQLEL